MKRGISWLFIFLIAFALTSCNILSLPDEVTYNGKSYVTGFYDSLYYIGDIPDTENYFEVNGYRFIPLNISGHDWVCTRDGDVYCLKIDYELEKDCYQDKAIFDFYCLVGNKVEPQGEYLLNAEDAELNSELINFADAHKYDPFRPHENKGQKEYLIPDDTDDCICVYKKSKDNLFSSSRGNTFYILEGKALLLYYFDFASGNKEEERMYAVELPERLAEYCISLYEEYKR